MQSLDSRKKRLGEIFGQPPGLLLKIPVDLKTLTIIVGKHIAFGGKTRLHGEIEPLENEDLRKEVLKLLGPRQGLTAAARYPSIRMKPTPHGGRYDSSHLHSDMWSGNPPGCIIMIPIFGDIKGGGVQFFEPTQNIDKMASVYDTYSNTPDFNPKYLGRMNPGHIHVVDAYCLHHTMPGGKRVSVDMRFVIDDEHLKGHDATSRDRIERRKGNFRPIWDDIEGRN